MPEDNDGGGGSPHAVRRARVRVVSGGPPRIRRGSGVEATVQGCGGASRRERLDKEEDQKGK